MISIQMKLQIFPSDRNGGIIYIPGCEPETTVTSTKLGASLRAQGLCSVPYVYVSDALAAIPGTKVIRFDNFGVFSGKAFLAFPPRTATCPSGCPIDYYGMLKQISHTDPIDPAANCDDNNGCCPVDFFGDGGIAPVM